MYLIHTLNTTESTILNILIDLKNNLFNRGPIYANNEYLSSIVKKSNSTISRSIKKLSTLGLIKIIQDFDNIKKTNRIIDICWDRIKFYLDCQKKEKEEYLKKKKEKMRGGPCKNARGALAKMQTYISYKYKYIKKDSARLILLSPKGASWQRFYSILCEIRGESNNRTKLIVESICEEKELIKPQSRPKPKIKPKPQTKLKLTHGKCLVGFNALEFAKQLFEKILTSRSYSSSKPLYTDHEIETLHLIPGRDKAILMAPEWEKNKNFELIKQKSIEAARKFYFNSD